MKKTVFFLLALTLVLSICTVGAMAARENHRNHTDDDHNITCDQQSGDCTVNCVDTDSIGVCDQQSDNCTVNCVDSDGSSDCDHQSGDCTENYVDTDSDGVCDNRTSDSGSHHGEREHRGGHHGGKR